VSGRVGGRVGGYFLLRLKKAVDADLKVRYQAAYGKMCGDIF
jgi:hypothetical protein